MTKTELRKTYKLLRKNLTEDQVEDWSLKIANQLLTLAIWDYEFYHTFLSITEHKEVNTDYLLNILSGKDKHIVISKSDFSTLEMTHYLLTDSTRIKKNEWNIPEPLDGISIDTKQINVIFIPLLAFDKTGNRIGYGKGFYDKFLAKCNPETIKIGLSFFKAEEKIADVFKGDVKLDYCVTPLHVYNFN
ncbi:5-formyltetrahydrofolate cyclo-ligase [Psychroserpens ponticola]|uniref:5-formyltetrahydrofolate cyclo-ligase n=1 Tax=Psychroserpens ponticola TaxID=2932268 RepID=A0ABY7RXP7_9FLAO|nr:5-formyltetrahydrofolate cyclo-ligase [Psychroserpens ponticola]WCO01461.1 5-formyltetrahydrofolate cyclo-ligase [Psychroserpens ponticola]